MATVLAAGAAVSAAAQTPKPVISYLEVFDVESGTHKVIKEFPYTIEAPNWTPDGKYLVYNAHGKLYEIAPGDHLANLNVQLRMIPAGGGEPVVLTELFGGQGTINVNSWSPDSKKFAFVSYRLKEEIEAPKKEMGVQMYSVRNLLGTPELYAKNHRYVLERLAQMGYSSIELACYDGGRFSGMAPADFVKTVKASGLEISSSHTTRVLSPKEVETADFSAALAWWDECIAAHKAAGIDKLIMSYYMPLNSEQQLKVVCDYINAIAQRCQDAGISFGYHNHNQEFARIACTDADGSKGHTTMMDYFMANTDPAKVFFELDVYWTVIGGASPVEYMKRYKGRYPMIHIKDHRELGQSGMVGFDAIFGNFEATGAKQFVVEMEYASTPNILQGLMDSAQYIRNASFVKESYR